MHKNCPRCKQPLIRAKRRGFDYIISRLLPVRRFQCVYYSCRWSGLRFFWAEDAMQKQEATPAIQTPSESQQVTSLPNTKL